MVQRIATNQTDSFLKDASVERYNLSKLNKTRIRFQIRLKKTTKSNAPKWTDVLKSEGEQQGSNAILWDEPKNGRSVMSHPDV